MVEIIVPDAETQEALHRRANSLRGLLNPAAQKLVSLLDSCYAHLFELYKAMEQVQDWNEAFVQVPGTGALVRDILASQKLDELIVKHVYTCLSGAIINKVLQDTEFSSIEAAKDLTAIKVGTDQLIVKIVTEMQNEGGQHGPG